MPFNPQQLEIGRLFTRPRLAEMWGYAGSEAISRGVVTPRGGGHIILFVTRQKQKSLTQYHDFISGDHLHWEGEKKHGNDHRIASAPANGETVHLFYRDIHHTPFRYHGPLQILLFEERTSTPSRFLFRLVHDMSASDDLATHKHELSALDETERERIVKARVGQGHFRESLLQEWSGCAVTGITAPDLLRASHIKPWRNSSNSDRLNRYNGLMLLPQYDHLFDRGYITFDDQGALIASPAIVTLPQNLLGISSVRL